MAIMMIPMARVSGSDRYAMLSWRSSRHNQVISINVKAMPLSYTSTTMGSSLVMSPCSPLVSIITRTGLIEAANIPTTHMTTPAISLPPWLCANLYDTERTEPKQRKKTTNIRNAEYVFLANRKEKSMIGIGKVALIA
jgi:hypothetical protein